MTKREASMFRIKAPNRRSPDCFLHDQTGCPQLPPEKSHTGIGLVPTGTHTVSVSSRLALTAQEKSQLSVDSAGM